MRSTSVSTFAVFLLLVVVTSTQVILRKGWYRTHHKGPKNVLTNVEVIDNELVSNPTYLRINGRIQNLHPGSVRNMDKLVTLRFPFCGMNDIMPGAFQNLPNLATLALMDNELRHVRRGVFNNMSISTLYLQRNHIETIDPGAFDNMPALYKLKVNSNKISSWESDWFKNCPSLTEILFRRNDFDSIPAKAFKNIKGSHSYNDTFIVDTKIYLSKNNISFIHPEALQGVEELSQLWLDRNEISEVDSKVFAHISQIGTLFLSKNRLISLPENMFPKLNADIEILDLTSNNNLTCFPYNIVSKVKLTNAQDIRRLDCKCIGDLVSRLKTDRKPNEIKTDCQNTEG